MSNHNGISLINCYFFCVESLISEKVFCIFVCSLAEILGGCLWLRKPAKSMVRHLEGKLESNYRVGSVYVETYHLGRSDY